MKIPYFNYCAILLLFSLIIITFIKNRKVKSSCTNLFFVNLIVNILSASCSSIYIFFDNLGPGNITQKYIFHTLYLLFHTWSIVAYFFYTISFTDDWQHFLRLHITNILIFLPVLITTGMIIANLFTPVVYYFNEEDIYKRIWPAFGALYFESAFYAIFSIIYIIKHRNLYTKNQFITILAIYPLLTISVILELITKHFVVESIFDAIGLLFVSTNIQRSEESISAETHFLNNYTYIWDMKKIYVNEKHVVQILINITNYETIQKVVGFKNKFNFLNQISNDILKAEKNNRLTAKNYYNNEGQFAVIASHRDQKKLLDFAEEINSYLNTTINYNGVKINLVANVCFIKNPENIVDYETFFLFTQELSNPKYYTGQLLTAKELYKNDYYQRLRNIDQILLNAISNNKFKVYYQPIFSIHDKKFKSAEALLRLFDDEYGTISPDFFIPAAEQNGLIFKITDYVLNEVCKFISSQEFKNLGIDYIEINLSASECMQDNLVERITSILKKYNVSPSSINIEITETALSLSEEKLHENLQSLTEAGLNISLDDFGSGYSNLQRLTMLPLEIVKFDKSFIHNIKDEKTRTTMLSNMGKMIHEMDIKFLIEGVETADILKYFEELHCDYVQGYFFSKPVSQQDFITFITNSLNKKPEITIL